ncbi:phosphoenolpyruvate carboxykinase domain-containing protein, partial [Acinetobacter sp. LH3_13]
NARVIDWIIRRVDGQVGAVDSPIGRLPRVEDLELSGLDLPAADLEELFAIDTASWLAEADLTEEFFDTFGSHLPAALRA